MKDRKREYRVFTIADWEREQDYLRKRHGEGWKFTGLTYPGVYHFVRCQPEDVVYQLDYNEEGIKHKDEYVRMFQDCGWEYIQDYAGYSYFRKPVSQMQGKMEEIFCDDESRLEMMRRMFLGRYTPLFIILVLLILPNLFLQLHSKEPDARCLWCCSSSCWRLTAGCLPPLPASTGSSSAGPGNKHRALPEKSRNNRPWFSRGGCHPFVRLLGGAAGGERRLFQTRQPQEKPGFDGIYLICPLRRRPAHSHRPAGFQELLRL